MLHRIAVLIMAVAPAGAFLAYGIAKTRSRWQDEALWRAIGMGMLGALAAAIVGSGLLWLLRAAHLGAPTTAVIEALVIASIIEETAKFLVLVFVAERDVDARRRQDIILLALGISLGFAVTENFFYLLIAKEPWRLVALARAATAVPAHALDGLAMGALLTAARLKLGRWRLAMALLVPAAMHAAYDLPLFLVNTSLGTGTIIAWLAIVPVLALVPILLCNRVLPAAREADRAAHVDTIAGPSPRQWLLGCGWLLASGPVLAVSAWLTFSDGTVAVAAAILAVIPICFGADLLLEQRRARQRPNALLDERELRGRLA